MTNFLTEIEKRIENSFPDFVILQVTDNGVGYMVQVQSKVSNVKYAFYRQHEARSVDGLVRAFHSWLRDFVGGRELMYSKRN
jgi:hypothetical protein